MKRLMLVVCFVAALKVSGQELYVFTEPASNMPAKSIGVIQSVKLLKGIHSGKTEHRHNTELMLGINKNLMLHAAGTFSNMYSPQLRFESVRVYGKYRFFSRDEMFRHFRMAAFAEASYNRNELLFDELALEGDNSGWQVGLIATQLLHKLAVSGSASVTGYSGTYVSYTADVRQPFIAMNYSLSAGYLIFPKNYTDYNQPNLNLYIELLGQRSLDQKKFLVDVAPALQLILKSQAKLNIGYRHEITSNMHRMSSNSWLIELEWTFLNALR